MAREFAKAWFKLFTDDVFAAQDPRDKWLYLALLGQPALNYAGIQPINMRRWRKACATDRGIPAERDLQASLARLEHRGFVFVDEDTGEVLVRSFIRNDELFKQPNVFKSALRALAQIESPKLAAVMVDELGRVEQPEVRNDKLRDELQRLRGVAESHLSRLAEGFVEGFPEPLPEGFGEGFVEGFPRPAEMEGFPEGFREGFQEGSVVVEVEVVGTDPALTVGSNACEETETGQTPPNDDQIEPTNTIDHEPPARCKAHRDSVDDPGPCGPCANFRKAHERWQTRADHRTTEAAREAAAQRREERQTRADIEHAAIDACSLCDTNGYRGGRVCSHDPDEDDRRRRGIEAARAAIRKTA